MYQIIILIASIVLYGTLGIKNVGFILFSAAVAYFAARGMKTAKCKKAMLWGTITVTVLLLVLFRLLPLEETVIPIFGVLTVPMGISYYTLQLVSYISDVYNGKYPAERNFLTFATYILYFPHLYLGPISRYNDFKNELRKKHFFNLEQFYRGLLRIVWGLFKKLCIATRLAIAVNTISGNPEKYNGFFAIFAMLLYSFELYADFSGGIDIVLGISDLFDIHLVENFKSPYYSESIKEFWNRWHISLGTWLRDYIYIPLGGNRKGKTRKIINVMITFLVSGVWHGFHYLLWGAFNGVLVCIGNGLKTKYKWLNRFITFLLVSFLWSFFIWPNTGVALKMIASVFAQLNIGSFISGFSELGLSVGNWIVAVVFCVLLALYDGKSESLKKRYATTHYEMKTALLCAMIIVILVFGVYGIGFNVNAFIYSKF